MEILNVTIVVRGTGGEVKKAIFDDKGKKLRGDVSILQEKGWSPAMPLGTKRAAFEVPKPRLPHDAPLPPAVLTGIEPAEERVTPATKSADEVETSAVAVEDIEIDEEY